jgi:hypothetical protein
VEAEAVVADLAEDLTEEDLTEEDLTAREWASWTLKSVVLEPKESRRKTAAQT